MIGKSLFRQWSLPYPFMKDLSIAFFARDSQFRFLPAGMSGWLYSLVECLEDAREPDAMTEGAPST